MMRATVRTQLQRSRGLPLLCLLLLAGLAMTAHWIPSAGLAGYAQRAKPELVLGVDKITRRNATFLQLGLLKMSHRFCRPEELAAASPEALALYGQPCPAPDRKKLRHDAPPSTALMPSLAKANHAGIVVVSLVCRSDHLFDPKHGIVTNSFDTGKPSERPAWLSARLGSRMLVESPVGLRIHGGFSRSTPNKSFSLVFRESYGGRGRCEPGVFFGADTPAASHIVLVNAADPGKFRGALGTEIAAALGCATSRLTPALLYLNGTRINAPFFLYQHQSPEFVQERFGLAQVDWVRVKPNQDRDNSEYVKWRQWIRRERPVILLSEEAARFDIGDLNAWALTMTFTSTSDNHQGGFFRDRTHRDAVWRSLVWDLDCAFSHDVPKHDGIPYIDDRDPIPWLHGDRARLFHRMVERTPEYRNAFQRFAHEALRDRLPREKLLGLADRYLHLARTHPASRIEIVRAMEDARAFLSTRHDTYLPYLDRHLQDVERATRVAVDATAAN